MKLESVEIRQVAAAEIYPLRLEVLRPGRPPESAPFAGDNEPTTCHFAAIQNGKIVGVASLFLAAMPEFPGLKAFQLRGMASAAQSRGQGIGRALTRACVEHARKNGVRLLWCNARTSAVGFYLKLGFEVVGQEFEIPDVGPHFRMRWGHV
jgi:ribosomal protein S18 acetylase RimI-like enzyme